MSYIRKLVTAAAVVALGVATTSASAQAAQSTSGPLVRPAADGIIAVLIGAYAPAPPGSTDGTSNTIAFGARGPAPTAFSIDIGTSENVASDGLGADFVRMADMGG